MAQVPGPSIAVGATYRLQLTPTFGFDHVAAIAPYLAGLGISHVYTSPYLQAMPGSTHGYDVVDHSRVNEELGGSEAHARMLQALDEAGLSQVVDVVPNHMAIGADRNRWWWDVLENGAASRFARYFDVDWNPPQTKLRNKILVPVLGDHYGRELEAGRIVVSREGSSFVVSYFEHRLPLAPRSLEPVLARAAHDAASLELESLAAAYGRLPDSSRTDEESIYERHRDQHVLNRRLTDLLDSAPRLGAVLDRVLADICSDPDELDRLLDRQNFRLAYWRTGAYELDYRRFFDIDHLVALRVDEDQVFEDTHGLILRWVAEGSVGGLRIDHPDGLTDPEGYLHRLARRTPGAWIIVEKILESDERLPEAWPVAGTTGYDFANLVTGLFVDGAAEPVFDDLYQELTGEAHGWPDVARAGKQQVLREVLAAELSRLTTLFGAVCERHRRYRDYSRPELAEALREVLASLDVYRTYVSPDRPACTRDVERVEQAIDRTAARREDLDPVLLGFLKGLLLMRVPVPQTAEQPETSTAPEIELAQRFQQLSGPVMAKGVEDTAFYNYNRFVALNEVGGDPGRFGVAPSRFHDWCREAQRDRPYGMLATSTHDTKRSEDVRARLALLSEIPQLWRSKVAEWRDMNAVALGRRVEANTEYLLYQVLVGAWPISMERAVAYMEKAVREAKMRTSWIEPDPEYEEALRSFVRSILSDERFLDDLEAFASRLAEPGRVNSLSQTLLKLTAPGVPDVYQGCELWNLSLVDPDNRRPVDFEHRRKLLAQLEGMTPEGALERSSEGLPKLLAISKALELRARRPEAFGAGSGYVPLEAEGAGAFHLIAFARGDRVLTVVPRLTWSRPAGLDDARLEVPAGSWWNVLTGDPVPPGPQPARDLLARFPVALLDRTG